MPTPQGVGFPVFAVGHIFSSETYVTAPFRGGKENMAMHETEDLMPIEIAGCVKKCATTNKHDVLQAYREMDMVLKGCLKNNIIQEGYTVDLDTEDGSRIKLTATPERTLFDYSFPLPVREENKLPEWMPIIDGDTPIESAEESLASIAGCYTGSFGIGSPCPPDVHQMICGLQAGQTLSYAGAVDARFSEGRNMPLLYCLKRDENGLYIQKCRDVTMDDPGFKVFASEVLKPEFVEYNDRMKIQEIYNAIKSPLTDNVFARRLEVEKDGDPRELIDSMVKSSIDVKGATGAIAIGKDRFIVASGKEEADINIYTMEGELVDKKSLALYSAWTRSHPVMIALPIKDDVTKVTSPYEHLYNEAVFMQEFETLLINKNYEQAAMKLGDYCAEFGTDAVVRLTNADAEPNEFRFMYTKKTGNHIDTCIILKEEGKDLDSPAASIKTVTVKSLAKDLEEAFRDAEIFKAEKEIPLARRHDSVLTNELGVTLTLDGMQRLRGVNTRSDTERVFMNTANRYYDGTKETPHIDRAAEYFDRMADGESR